MSAELHRVEDWPDRLAQFIDAHRDMPFDWGPNDCVSAAIVWVHAMTGTVVRPIDWTTEAEARATLEEAGGLIAAVTGVLGRPTQNYAEARRGDIGLVDQETGPGLMICTGTHWAGPGIEEMLFKPLREARLVWIVG